MSSQNEPKIISVQSRGIYHGMPVFSDDIKGLKALILGANGISGQAMVSALSENPERWSQVYALSRKASSITDGPTVKRVLADLLEGPEAIAKVLIENNIKV
jgi:hypothetical protein